MQLRVGWLVSVDAVDCALDAEEIEADATVADIIRWSTAVERRERVRSANPYDPIRREAAVTAEISRWERP